MDESSQSPHRSDAAISAQALLQTGLAAVKRKDYWAAIAQLEAILDLKADKPIQLKAEMGLVVAYERTGAPDAAIALCQSLADSSNRQARQWAQGTLTDLRQRYPHLAVVEGDRSTPTAPTPALPDLADGLTRRFSPPPPSRDSPANLRADEAIASPLKGTHGSGKTDGSNGSKASAESEAPTQPSSDALTQSIGPNLQSSVPAATSGSTRAVAPVEWRQAGRAQKWGSLGPVDRATLRAVMIGTAIALILMLRAVCQLLIFIFNQTIARTTFPFDLRGAAVYGDPVLPVILSLVGLFLAVPLLLTWLLSDRYQLQPLSLEALGYYSPEATRVLKRVFGQRRRPVPALGLLPTPIPILLTYGALPQSARIVVSQGLLEQLKDDEIATLYAGEIGHITNQTFALMSWVALTTQLPYLVYETLAEWGDRQDNPVLYHLARVGALFSYGLFWLCRVPGLWLSRLRLFYSDRSAVEITGNPNALTRALLKLSLDIAKDVAAQGETATLLERFELLTPVGAKTALTLGSLYPQVPGEPLLLWDYSNPFRRWLAIPNTHSSLGDRLQSLMRYAHHWHIHPELNLNLSASSWRLAAKETRPFLLQISPYLGCLAGLAIAILLWILGALAANLNWLGFAWMWGDRSLLWGFGLIGFSFGTFCRINHFFPDIVRSQLLIEPSLPDLLTHPTDLPIHRKFVRLQGTLLGRRGIAALPGQDLWLKCESGIVQLHHSSQLGPIGDLTGAIHHPANWINRSVTVTGWFRRGATPWIDVDTLQLQQGKLLKGGHPIWSTLVASLAAVLGCYLIYTGR